MMNVLPGKFRAAILCLLIFCGKGPVLHSQTPGLYEELKKLAVDFKKDDRGPYQAIRWFCPDGTMVAPPARCSQPGGIMHALPKERVMQIARDYNLHLGQILAGTDIENFWDAARQNSRLKQYQVEKYLQAADDGWIFRKARYYRGAVQAEDEEKWGKNFFREMLANNERLESYYFLLRHGAQDIPHQAIHSKQWENIRTLSKEISDKVPEFFNLRVKLHGQPEPGDAQQVKNFLRVNTKKIDEETAALFNKLVEALDSVYREATLENLASYVPLLPDNLPLKQEVKKLASFTGKPVSKETFDHMAALMWELRRSLPGASGGALRLTLLDLSLELEQILFTHIGQWQPKTLGKLLEKNYILARGAAACGFLEIWEWEAVEPLLRPPAGEKLIPFASLWEKADLSRRMVEWGTGMFRAEYNDVITLFANFEPKASGLLDHRIRMSLLLPLGKTAAALWELAAQEGNIETRILDLPDQGRTRGLNPGIAVGELEVVEGPPTSTVFSSRKIYVMEHPPADLKPVAGILTAAEGNLVSHVQLLARSLGIPNAVISPREFKGLKAFSGQVVFYAVSPRGAVRMKPAAEMSTEEKQLVEEKKRSEDKIMVPLDKIHLEARFKPLSDLRAGDSGRYCGPKAANLGELKALFPGQVVDGLVIPFGFFRQHLDQPFPGRGITCWEFLRETFRDAAAARQEGVNEEAVEAGVLERLAQLRDAIVKLPFAKNFQEDLEKAFQSTFGVKLGELAVFVRSDTNMEDLKDFTGAGLNLTVFNVLEKEKILQAVRSVWASPFSERSYSWRQKYLRNPENVYPSILLLPTVNVDKSGVLITTGVSTTHAGDMTAAFSRGAGGAVEGQVAEAYLLRHDGVDFLLSPSREMGYNILPASGGTARGFARFNRRLLSPADLKHLRRVAENIKTQLIRSPAFDWKGALDIELGFKDDRIWLFQVRPYLENKKAKSSLYLKTLDPELPRQLDIPLDKKL